MRYFKQLLSEDKTDDIITSKINIALTGGTGTGKTSYILDRVCKLADKVLYYVPRTALLEQIKQDAEKKHVTNIKVKTTQTFENLVERSHRHDINRTVEQLYIDIICEYDVVVFDEVHTIFTDALFNNTSDYTYELLKVLLENNDITVIMMSATGDCIFYDLKSKGLLKDENIYNIQTDYSYLTATPLRATKDCVSDIIAELFETTSPDDKIIYFTSNINKSLELKKEFEHKYNYGIAFACSRNHTKYRNINEIDKVKDGTFPGKLLICTTALDVGINLTDAKIKYIITDIYNLESLIQCIGRRRVEQGEQIQLYFKNWKSKVMNGMIGTINKELNQIEHFKTDYSDFLQTYERNHKNLTNYIYFHEIDNYWKYNEVGEVILKYNLDEFEHTREYGLSYMIQDKCCNINLTDEQDTEENKPSNTRYKLFELVNRKIYSKDRTVIIDAVSLVEDKSKNRHKSRDYETLKSHILSQYQLDLKKEYDKAIRKTYWVLEETDETFDYAKDKETIERSKWDKVFQRNLEQN